MAKTVSVVDQQKFLEGYQSFITQFKAAFGKKIVQGKPEQIEEQLQILSRREVGSSHALFFRKLKELTLLGYFTSEKVGTEILQFDPVPGKYQGCRPLAEIGNSWTLG